MKISELASAASLAGGELVELSQLSATVTITATTISADASDNSFNDSATGFVSAGFAVGDNVRVQGFTGSGANNILSGRITALTAGKMTIGGADGDVIVNDAAGESVTITRWESRRATAQDIAALATAAGGAPVITEAGASRDIDPSTDAGRYIRFTATGAKTANFDVADGFASPKEYHITNRAASGNLTLTGTGFTFNEHKGGTLVLEPGDTVTVKIVDTDEADLIGSTEAA